MHGASRWVGAALIFTGFTAFFCFPPEIHAASHLWRIHEVFSNADGSVQYLVLHECCGSTGELFIKNLEVESKATGHIYKFPTDLTGSSARKYLLLATQAFADLPGVPQPDFILPPDFFSTTGDKIWYSEVRNYDSYTFKPGDMPVDGLHALRVTNYTTDASEVVENAPINYAGATGHFDLSHHDFVRGDCDADGKTGLTDAVYFLRAIFQGQGSLGCEDACEMNGDGELDVSDAVRLILYLFASGPPLPEPISCGADPSADHLGCSSYNACP